MALGGIGQFFGKMRYRAGWEVLEVQFQLRVQVRRVGDPSEEAFPAVSLHPR